MYYISMKRAKLTIYYGPMFSGKSALLIKDILSNIDTSKLVFKPVGDVRSSKVYTREGLELEAIAIDNPTEMLDYIKDWVDVVYIDELHFYGDGLVDVVKQILDKGVDVVIAGLDKDFRAVWFESSKQLIELADKSVKLKARCHICGEGSTNTARFVNGEPASKDAPIILSDKAEDTVEYKTLCNKCHPFKGE